MTVFSERDLDAFVDLLEPLLSPEAIARVRIGRAACPVYPIRREAGFTLIQLPRGATEPGSPMLGETTNGIRDIGDAHVVEAALRHRCRYICTSNSRDFVDGQLLGELVEVIRPDRLFRELTA